MTRVAAAYPEGYVPKGAVPYAVKTPIERVEASASLTASVVECRSGAIDGVPVGPSLVGLWGAAVVPPDEQRRAPDPNDPISSSEHMLVQLWSTDATEGAAFAAWEVRGLGSALADVAGAPSNVAVEARGEDLTFSFGFPFDGRLSSAPSAGLERLFVVQEGIVTRRIDEDLFIGATTGGRGELTMAGDALYESSGEAWGTRASGCAECTRSRPSSGRTRRSTRCLSCRGPAPGRWARAAASRWSWA